MQKIITISREFGSGGRELGKRLAETLEIAYYDREIITAIAQKSGLAQHCGRIFRIEFRGKKCFCRRKPHHAVHHGSGGLWIYDRYERQRAGGKNSGRRR